MPVPTASRTNTPAAPIPIFVRRFIIVSFSRLTLVASPTVWRTHEATMKRVCESAHTNSDSSAALGALLVLGQVAAGLAGAQVFPHGSFRRLQIRRVERDPHPLGQRDGVIDGEVMQVEQARFVGQ